MRGFYKTNYSENQMNNNLNEIIKTFKSWIEVTEEDGFVALPESLCKKILTIIEQMAETEGAE